jgi:hypothetical protein
MAVGVYLFVIWFNHRCRNNQGFILGIRREVLGGYYVDYRMAININNRKNSSDLHRVYQRLIAKLDALSFVYHSNPVLSYRVYLCMFCV